MKKFCESFREHAMKIINFKKKKMKFLTNKQQDLYEKAKICCICTEYFEDKHTKDKKYCRVRDPCHYVGEYKGAAHNICNLKCSVSNDNPIDFHDESNYYYHFIIKELERKIYGRFNCLAENTKKYITFLVLIEEEVTRIFKNLEETTKNLSYRLKLLTTQDLW